MRDFSTSTSPSQRNAPATLVPPPDDRAAPRLAQAEPQAESQAEPARAGLDVRAIAEAALLLDVTVLLSLLRVFIPIPGFQGLVALACLAPFVVLTLRRGARVGLVATAAAYILLSCFVGPIFGTAALVFGGLGTLFAWAARHRLRASVTVVIGAALYGVLYLLLPFLFGLAALRINLAQTLHDVQRQAGSFLNSLGHLTILGVPFGAPFVATLSRFGPGRALLDFFHGIALAGLTHPLATLIAVFALYSLVHVWAYFIVSVELYRRLPVETRRDAQGQQVDFFSVR